MITWMQRHKKWLITTIWISTIAFVGAGFVGWGSYDISKKGGDLAKVGDISIQNKDLQNQYQRLYSQYQNMIGESFNKEMAKKFKLEETAYKNAINYAMFLNFSNELGLDVTDKEIAQELVKIDSFLKDGKFNKDIYIKLLAQNRTTPVDFEASIKKDLLNEKVRNLMKDFTTSTKDELSNMQSVLFSQDRIKINIIDANQLTIDLNDENLKAYWEQNKNNYMSPMSYMIEKSIIDIDDMKNKDKVRDHSLKTYLKLKKGKIKFDTKETIFENQLSLNKDNLEKFKNATLGKVMKPMLENNQYIILKIVQKIQPKTLSFDEAIANVTQDYKSKQKNIMLNKASQDSLKNFVGDDIGFVSRESYDKITGLSDEEAMKFLDKLFSSTSKTGIINISSKAVVYEILDSKLSKYDETKDKVVQNTLDNLKYRSMLVNFIDTVQKQYPITRY